MMMVRILDRRSETPGFSVGVGGSARVTCNSAQGTMCVGEIQKGGAQCAGGEDGRLNVEWKRM